MARGKSVKTKSMKLKLAETQTNFSSMEPEHDQDMEQNAMKTVFQKKNWSSLYEYEPTHTIPNQRYEIVCCVFRPALGCCAHAKAGRNQAWANPEKFSANPENTDNYFWKTFTNI